MRKYLLTVLAALITFGVLGYFFSPYLLAKVENFKESILEKSTADLYISGNRVYLDFKITKDDETGAKIFFQNLGADAFYKGASFELDQNTILGLSKVLPTKFTLIFKPGSIGFKNYQAVLLKPAVSGQRYEFATASSKAVLNFTDNRDFSLEAIDPRQLVEEATSTGKLNLSQKAESLFPILGKVGKIYLMVTGKDIEGEVTLKD